MKVLFVTSEAYPFSVSGGLGDVSAALPKALRQKKVACRVVMPLYGDIPEQYREQMKFVCSFYVPLAWRSQYCGVYSLNHGGVVYYFLDNEYYFKRHGLYGFYDDGERYAFFSRAVLHMLEHISFAPEIIHTNDWQSALVNVYINAFYRDNPKFYSIKTLFTIHNIQYQGQYDPYIIPDVVGVEGKWADTLICKNGANYMKGGIENADRISTVSPSYAEEILESWCSFGMDDLLRARSSKLCGILNGIDTDVYDPQHDAYLTAAYSAADMTGKAACKKQLRSLLELPDDDRPILAVVSRLVSPKGIDLIKRVAKEIIASDIQLVVLGTGEYEYERFFNDFALANPDSCAFRAAFSPELAHKIYAGADMFLMPSRFEPCGLAQMIALRYGTVPIVRETGGLRDSIRDCSLGSGNGFTFSDFNAHEMLAAIQRARTLYSEPQHWQDLTRYCMSCDFSWKASAQNYIELYETMLRLW